MPVSKYILLNSNLKLYLVYAYIFQEFEPKDHAYKKECSRRSEEHKPYRIRSMLDPARVLHLLLSDYMKYVKHNENHVFYMMLLLSMLPFKDKKRPF